MFTIAFTPLHSLDAFLVVARHLSYAAAARDLGVSASALSQSVRQLEERLGVPLLARTSRNVALTEAGHRLLDNAGPAIDQALEALRTVKARRRPLPCTPRRPRRKVSRWAPGRGGERIRPRDPGDRRIAISVNENAG
ncbi:MAG: LysR family transcriptional regulator [Polyangiaceae bacterium]